ncbi:MAG: hypothetical protein GXX96_39430 [Planctomycetaceae bacterium]|nr:hypothetical protein [Planctomycetaceae bacterium]
MERFAREVLLKLGYHRKELRVLPYPVGRGSAKQWIEKQYPLETQAYRRKASHQRVGLLVGTDADESSVEGRCQRLACALESNGLTPRSDNEHIALWIPKWHIETWILFLSGEAVNEEADYKDRMKHVQIPFARIAEVFVERYRATDKVPGDMLPSLDIAITETERLDF